MKLSELHNSPGATKAPKRLGRGIGSGTGKTGGRGVKGQKSRSGVSINGFEGGQMPIYRRLPKRGFRNIFSKNYNIISLAQIQKAIDSGKLTNEQPITVSVLKAASIFRREKDGFRLLSDGNLKSMVSFKVMGASKKAIEKVEKAGGTVEILKSKKS